MNGDKTCVPKRRWIQNDAWVTDSYLKGPVAHNYYVRAKQL
jgi:hypothetical protein